MGRTDIRENFSNKCGAMKAMARTLRSSRIRIAAALPALLVAALLVPTASTAAPTSGGEMSLLFARPSARVVGGQALILVRCEGSRRGICSGTVTISIDGRRHRAPFSLIGGTRQSLTVGVGSGQRLRGRRARAIASTAQPAGGYVRERETLRFR